MAATEYSQASDAAIAQFPRPITVTDDDKPCRLSVPIETKNNTQIANELRVVILFLTTITVTTVFCFRWWTDDIPFVEDDWKVRAAIGALIGWWLTCGQLGWIEEGRTQERWLLTWTMTCVGGVFLWLAYP